MKPEHEKNKALKAALLQAEEYDPVDLIFHSRTIDQHELRSLHAALRVEEGAVHPELLNQCWLVGGSLTTLLRQLKGPRGKYGNAIDLTRDFDVIIARGVGFNELLRANAMHNWQVIAKHTGDPGVRIDAVWADDGVVGLMQTIASFDFSHLRRALNIGTGELMYDANHARLFGKADVYTVQVRPTTESRGAKPAKDGLTILDPYGFGLEEDGDAVFVECDGDLRRDEYFTPAYVVTPEIRVALTRSENKWHDHKPQKPCAIAASRVTGAQKQDADQEQA